MNDDVFAQPSGVPTKAAKRVFDASLLAVVMEMKEEQEEQTGYDGERPRAGLLTRLFRENGNGSRDAIMKWRSQGELT